MLGVDKGREEPCIEEGRGRNRKGKESNNPGSHIEFSFWNLPVLLQVADAF